MFRAEVVTLILLVIDVLTVPTKAADDPVAENKFKSIQVGDIEVNSTHSFEVRVRNTGTTDFVFDQISRSCGCVSITPESGTIKAGDVFTLNATLKPGADIGHFGTAITLIESASKREKQIQIEFDVVPSAQVNFGKPLKIDVEKPNERVTFTISTSIPEIDLSQYSVLLGTGCLDEIVVKSRSAKELTVEAKVAQIKENENVLSKTCTIQLKSKNPKSKAIPDLRLVVDYVGKVRFFPSQAIFHDKDSDFRAVLLIESNSFLFERESLDFRILRESKLVTTAKVITSQELTSHRWSFKLSLDKGQEIDDCDSLEVWNGNEFIGRLPFKLLEMR